MPRTLLAAFAIFNAYILQPSIAFGHDTVVGPIKISHPHARASLSVKATNGVIYMIMHNSGVKAERLIAISTYISDRAELHGHTMEGNVMKMHRVESIEILPGGSIELKPGGLHVMLMGLRTPLQKGKTFPMSLTFENAGTIDVDVVIEASVSKGKIPNSSHHKSH